MNAETPGPGSCDCPETDGKVYHQRGTCTDPVVAKLGWYADGPQQPTSAAGVAATPGQAANRRWHEVRWPHSAPGAIAKEWEHLSDRAKAAWEAAAIEHAAPELAAVTAERDQLRAVLQWLADDGNLEARDRLAAIEHAGDHHG